MVLFYKTIDGRVQPIENWEPSSRVRCIAPTEAEVNYLVETFSLTPEFFRAATDEEESSHIDSEDDNTLIIIDAPVLEKEEESTNYSTMPLAIIFASKTVITVCMKRNILLEEIASGTVKDVQTNLKTRFVLTLLLRVATRYLQYLKQIERFSYSLETQLRKEMKNKGLLQLYDVEKSLVYFSSSLKANEITIEKIMRGRVIRLYDEDQDLIEDVLIEVRQGIDMSRIQLSILQGSTEMFSSMIANNLNVVMKVLTSLTLLVSIPTLISGLYGMNVSWLPGATWWFPLILSGVIMAIVFVILRRKDMI